LLGGDAGDPAKVDLAARFLVVFAPQVVLYGLGIVFTGILQAHRRFAGPAITPLLSSVVVAGAYLLFAAVHGGRSVGDLDSTAELVLGVGTTLGVVALTLPLLFPLRRLHLGLRPSMRLPVGAAPRVRRLAVAGVVTLAGQQLVALVAIRLANAGAPDGTQVVYLAGMAMFLLPWAAVAVPLATSVYPQLSATADEGDDTGYRRALAPVTVLTVVGSAVAAAGLVAVSGPLARLFLVSGDDAAAAAALQGTIAAFAPGLVGYGLVAVLTRALYARGLWQAPTVCVTAGWLVAVAADLVLSDVLPAADRGLALGAGHSIGVTVAGIALLVVVVRTAGAGAVAGLARTGLPALVAAVLAAVAGVLTAQALGADPVPRGDLLAVLGAALGAGAVVLAVAGVVMMGTARRPLTAAVRQLRGSGRGEVTGG